MMMWYFITTGKHRKARSFIHNNKSLWVFYGIKWDVRVAIQYQTSLAQYPVSDDGLQAKIVQIDQIQSSSPA